TARVFRFSIIIGDTPDGLKYNRLPPAGCRAASPPLCSYANSPEQSEVRAKTKGKVPAEDVVGERVCIHESDTIRVTENRRTFVECVVHYCIDRVPVARTPGSREIK